MIQFRVGETNILCTDLNRSLRFYRDTLGFEEVEREGQAVRLRLGSAVVLLLPIAKNVAADVPYGDTATVSFDLLVDDIAAAVEHLRKNDVRFAKDWNAGDDSTFIRDPDGLVIELIEFSEGQ